MFARPQTVHKWFDQLIGEWSFEQVCNLPDGGREMWWRSSGTIVYFSCTDCGVEASRIEAAGGKVQMPKSPIGQYGFHPQHTERLADYWAESLGGPKEYTDAMGSESQVVRMHSGNGEHQEMDERARTCFAQALDDADIPEERRLMARLSYADVSTSEQISEHNLVEVMSKCFADLASL